MRLTKKRPSVLGGGEMTPMIDMTFQLIAFFMVLLNFTDVEQDQRIKLPASELAKPPDQPFEEPRTLQLMRNGDVLFAGERVRPGPLLERLLLVERQVLRRTKNKSPATVTVIIRADAAVQFGQVQEIIQLCQKTGFEKYALRARQKEARRRGDSAKNVYGDSRSALVARSLR
jgi:biopolymer transport protein ExbD